jgi:hypothetical protein
MLETYGITGMIILILFILLIKFGNKVVELVADKAVKGDLKFPVDKKRKLRKEGIFKVNKLLTELM